MDRGVHRDVGAMRHTVLIFRRGHSRMLCNGITPKPAMFYTSPEFPNGHAESKDVLKAVALGLVAVPPSLSLRAYPRPWAMPAHPHCIPADSTSRQGASRQGASATAWLLPPPPASNSSHRPRIESRSQGLERLEVFSMKRSG